MMSNDAIGVMSLTASAMTPRTLSPRCSVAVAAGFEARTVSGMGSSAMRPPWCRRGNQYTRTQNPPKWIVFKRIGFPGCATRCHRTRQLRGQYLHPDEAPRPRIHVTSQRYVTAAGNETRTDAIHNNMYDLLADESLR